MGPNLNGHRRRERMCVRVCLCLNACVSMCVHVGMFAGVGNTLELF